MFYFQWFFCFALMASSVIQNNFTVAILGNPNTGKSTLFSALAGVPQQTGNYPGVTVEKKIGTLCLVEQKITLVDLPGTYSLAPHSPDEMVAVDVLLGQRQNELVPDAVLCILDASNLQRNLYLVSQVMELGLPMVIALNMSDVAERKGIHIDVQALQERLQVPIVQTEANKRVGIEQLKQELAKLASIPLPEHASPFPEVFTSEVLQIQKKLNAAGEQNVPLYLAARLLLDTSGYIEKSILDKSSESEAEEIRKKLLEAKDRLAKAGHQVPGVEAIARYGWVGQMLDGIVEQTVVTNRHFADRADRFLTHRLWGSLFFLVLMGVLFQAVYSWAGPVMDGLESVVEWLGQQAGKTLPEGALRSLVVDGIIAGVGAVLVFLPQILLLFMFIAVLEDCGYMARAAYLMDKLMSKVGLSGKSFIPLLSSFACAVPGIMATRVISNRRDRLVTILIAPLMSCSARLPVYLLLIGAFIPPITYLGGWVGLHGLMMFAMYFLGMVVAVGVAIVLKKTLLPGETPPFVMELPGFKIPSARIITRRVYNSGKEFILRAGTLIFAVSVLVWASAYFPQDPVLEKNYQDQLAQLKQSDMPGETEAKRKTIFEERKTLISNSYEQAQMEQSYLGRAGKFIEPTVRPLGWDWKIGCAVIASFPAREVVIGTLGVLYRLGEVETDETISLRKRMQKATWPNTKRPVYTIPVAVSIMVFFALCAQCVATLAVIKRETDGWRWPLFTFVYMTTLAYIAALLTYQIGSRMIS